MSDVAHLDFASGVYDIKDELARDEIEVLKQKTVYLTPQMFGAVADGVADDYQAFQDMIDYALENLPTREFPNEASCIDWSNVTLKFTGRYAVSKPVSFTNTYGLNIDNLNLIATDTFNGDGLLMITNVNRNTRITNTSLNGSLIVNACLFINDYTLTTELVNVELIRFKNYGLYAKGKGHELKCVNLKINQVEWGEVSNINNLVTQGTGLYLDTERYDNNLSQIIINYCHDYCINLLGGSTTIMNSHFYGGDVLNVGSYNAFINCYFDSSKFRTNGFVRCNDCHFLNSGNQTTPFIYLTEQQATAYKYEVSSFCNNIFSADTDTPSAIDKGVLSALPKMNTIGNAFYYVTPFVSHGNLVQVINPWDTPLRSGGNSDNGYAQYGDLIYVWGTATEDGFQTYPDGITISLVFNIMCQRLDSNNNNVIPFPNTIQSNRFWINSVGSGSQVKWLVIGRQ